MKSLLVLSAGLVLSFSFLVSARPGRVSSPQGVTLPTQIGPAPAERPPVVVELFTSEGCSSCPPADAVLARLQGTQPVPRAEVIALEEHVDYWDRLGWADPYSSAMFTERQREYADAFHTSSIYTPQMIVDGRSEFIGSQYRQALQAIAQAAQREKTPVRLNASSCRADGGELTLDVRIPVLRGAGAGETAEVFLAITEDKLHSEVRRGENAGRSLDHSRVVRKWRRLGAANTGAPTPFTAAPRIRLASKWKRADLRAVIFVQEKRSRHILGAASIPLC